MHENDLLHFSPLHFKSFNCIIPKAYMYKASGLGDTEFAMEPIWYSWTVYLHIYRPYCTNMAAAMAAMLYETLSVILDPWVVHEALLIVFHHWRPVVPIPC